MKKVLSIIFLFLLILPFVLAVEFDIKPNYNQGETMIARVSGNFLDSILPENVYFYRGHVRVPVVSSVAKINEEYYIYALLPENQANYTISIKDVRYMKGSQIVDDEISSNFSISNEIADFSINPGFIVTKGDFSIKLQNLQDKKITVNVKTIPVTNAETSGDFFSSLFGGGTTVITNDSDTSVSLLSGEIKKIDFQVSNANQYSIKNVEFSSDSLSYILPVYITANQSMISAREFRFSPALLNFSIPTNTNITKVIYLYNTGQIKLQNIKVTIPDSLQDYISISQSEISELDSGSSAQIEVNISSKYQGTFEERLKAESSTPDIIYLPIIMKVLKDYIPSNLSDNSGDDYQIIFDDSLRNCVELGGKTCLTEETCNGLEKDSFSGKCCIGTCELKKETSWGAMMGWALLIVIILFLVWFFFKKYRGARRDIDLVSIGEGKSKYKKD